MSLNRWSFSLLKQMIILVIKDFVYTTYLEYIVLKVMFYGYIVNSLHTINFLLFSRTHPESMLCLSCYTKGQCKKQQCV